MLALAKAAYQGQPDFEIDAARSALLVIDMQDEFVKPGWTPYRVPEATRQVPRIRWLIDNCDRLSMPVIYTVFADTDRFLDRTRSGPLMPNRYPVDDPAEDTWFVEGNVYPELAPEPTDIVIRKPSYGAFYDTPLDTVPRDLGRDTVIICGTLTNFCCGMTARQAYERGYRCSART